MSNRSLLFSHIKCLGLRVNFAKSSLSPSNVLRSWEQFSSPYEGDSRARTCSGHTTSRGLLQNWSLSPPQCVSEDARPHGLCVTSTTAGPALHEAPSVLAKTASSSPCMASRTPKYRGEPGLCKSSNPSKVTPMVQTGRDHGHSLQKEGYFDRCIQHRLGDAVRGQTGLRLLVGHRGSATHQLPEDDSNMSSPSDLLTRPEGTQSASLLKQHESGFLHTSPGRAHLETSLRDGETPLGMGTSQSEMTWNF